ncbi:uncharacterized, partial [Tachysurus ichikawai]
TDEGPVVSQCVTDRRRPGRVTVRYGQTKARSCHSALRTDEGPVVSQCVTDRRRPGRVTVPSPASYMTRVNLAVPDRPRLCDVSPCFTLQKMVNNFMQEIKDEDKEDRTHLGSVEIMKARGVVRFGYETWCEDMKDRTNLCKIIKG